MWVILLVGAAMRVALWFWFRNEPIHIWDELQYDRLATNLVLRGEFAVVPGIPTSERPPLYPALVAAVYWVAGVGHFQAVRLLQAALSLVTALCLYRLGALLYGRRVALGAVGAYVLYPSLLGFNNLLLTEVLFACLLCAACLVSIRALRAGSVPGVAVAGSLFGLAALTRSAIWPFAVAASLGLLGWWPGSPRRRVVAATVLATAFALTIAPWVIRNTAVQRVFVLIDSVSGRNLMQGNYRFTPLERPWDAVSLPEEQSWHRELRAVSPIPAGSTEGQIDRLALRAGLRFIREHPWLTLGRDIVKLVRFWGLERELVAGAARGYFGPLPAAAIVLLALLIVGGYVVAMVTGVFGLVMAPPADRRAHWLLLLAIGAICLVHTVTFGHSRYHLPLMPLVLLYSASAGVHARAIWARRHDRAFRLAMGLCALLVLGWGWEIGVDAGRHGPALLRPP
jgi:4-amino-4-deoxy-L-arabinose transferase-like glycosyltransferase